jgi:peptidoglycan/xylan/chitin deacetylase (PgdA/CDA1 family)
VREAVKGTAWASAYHTGLSRLVRRAHRHRLLVLCYHGLTDGPSTDWLLHPLESFEREMTFLASHYRVLPIDDALDEIYGPGLSEPTAVITFDDGYRNNFTLALPVLQRLNMSATIYLTTGLIGTDEVLWTTELQLAIEETDATELRIGDALVDGPLGADVGSRRTRGGVVRQRLKRLPDGRRRALAAEVVETLGRPSGTSQFALMTTEELGLMDQQGRITFGGHSRTHPILSSLDSSALEDEICGSIDDLAGLAHVSRTFAYPNGQPEDYDDRCIQLLSSSGIRAGLTTRQWLHHAGFDRYQVRRVVVDGGISFPDFVASVSGVKEVMRR